MQANLVDAGPRALGDDGLVVGPLAFGCWRFVHTDPAEAQRILETAIETGMNLVDTADVYGLDWGGSGFGANEEVLGKVLAAAPQLRDQIVLATKGGIVPPVPYDSSPASLRAACEASLRRLGVDVIDLYQVHRPDAFTHPAAIAETLAELRAEGKVRQVGVSNHTAWQYDALSAFLGEHGISLATFQLELSGERLEGLHDGTLDRCLRDRVTPLAWSPLGGGRLVLGEGVRPELVAVLDELAEREGTDRAGVALAFVLTHPARPIAILGSQQPPRLRAATAAVSVRLDRTDCYRIVEASEGEPLP
jgi:predicted oxidoreductase